MVYEKRIEQIVAQMRASTASLVRPAADHIVTLYGKNPYLVLISCILSLRTKDTVSLPASLRLFARAYNPEAMCTLSVHDIEAVIYPVGFYRTKARTIKALSVTLIEQYNGVVPSTAQQLLQLKGVGLKTAHLVLSVAFDIPALCVDTHVHRIANRLGLVQTDTPQQTEQELRQVIPIAYWSELNSLFVMWGQNICVPISPHCSRCPLAKLCPKVGVIKYR